MWRKGEGSGTIVREKEILLMCDQCAIQRELVTNQVGDAEPKGTVDGVSVGYFSDLYTALAASLPGQVIFFN